ncbi:MAG: hypothetical protein KBG84_12520 [Planctomycetes bacterium]|nr:hypothetical protein [Planctomycetota bacterium]
MKRLFTLFILSIATGSPLFANYPPTPHGMKGYWESTEPGGKRQFRMLPYGFGFKIDEHYHDEFPNGLYPDAKATKPLWSVDFYEESLCWHNESPDDRRPLYLSENGRWLVRIHAMASKPDDTVLWFYEDGKLIKSHTLQDVMGESTESGAPHWCSHAEFKDAATFGVHLPAERHSIKRIDFDVKTGTLLKRVNGFTTARVNEFGYLLLAVSVPFLILALILKFMKRPKPAQ